MKKLFLLLIICGLSSTAFSQFLKKGSIIGGGSFQFQTTKYKDSDSKSHSLSIMPWAGYLIIDNLVLGTSFDISSSGSKSSGYKSSSNGISVGPMVRYYLDQGLFFSGQYTFGSGKIKDDFTNSTTKFNYSIYRLGVGYAARITDTVLLEPTIGYYGVSNGDNTYSGLNNNSSGLFISGGFTIILKNVQ